MKKILLSLLLLPGMALGMHNEQSEKQNDPRMVVLVKKLYKAHLYKERVVPAGTALVGMATFPFSLTALFQVAKSASFSALYNSHQTLHSFLTIPASAGCIAAAAAYLFYKAVTSYIVDDPVTVKLEFKEAINDPETDLTAKDHHRENAITHLRAMQLSFLPTSQKDANELYPLAQQKMLVGQSK